MKACKKLTALLAALTMLTGTSPTIVQFWTAVSS